MTEHQSQAASLDDLLKDAQVRKFQAESEKLRAEAAITHRNARYAVWIELIKLVSAALIGVGGALAAYIQFERAESKIMEAKSELATIEAARHKALEDTRIANEARDKAIADRKDAEAATAEFKSSIAQTQFRSSATPEKGLKHEARLVYVQFQGRLTREFVTGLRKSLNDSGHFSAPGAQRIAGTYQNEIRYFSDSDLVVAQNLQQAVESFYAVKGCHISMDIKRASLTAKNGNTPPPEVWLSEYCKL